MKQEKEIIHYDKESDVLYLGARKGIEEECVEIAPGINAELDEKGHVIGVEVLNALKVFKPIVKSLEVKSPHIAAQ